MTQQDEEQLSLIEESVEAEFLRKKKAFQKEVNKLTNWQHNQWARAGYPGQGLLSIDTVHEFTNLLRPSGHTNKHEDAHQEVPST